MHTEAIYANEVEQPDDENQNTLGTNVVRSISFILDYILTTYNHYHSVFNR
jgi:hypothetical protein